MRNYYGPGSGPIWQGYVQCTGTEESLAFCERNLPTYTYSHSYDVSIYCPPGLFSDVKEYFQEYSNAQRSAAVVETGL